MPGLRALGGRLWVLYGLGACLLAGCVTPRPWLGPLPPQDLGVRQPLRQHVEMKRDGQVHSLQVVLRSDGGRLTLIGLSDLGQRLFTLTSDGRHAEMTSRVPDLEGLDPAWILTGLQLVYWPLPVLRAALPDGMRLEQEGALRTLWRGDELQWFSVRQAGADQPRDITVYNLRLGYRLTIRSAGS